MRKTYKAAGIVSGVLFTLTAVALTGGSVMAQPGGTPRSDGSVIPEDDVVDLNAVGTTPMLYTQSFQLERCTIKPRGINRYFDPLIPGYKFVTVNPAKVLEDGSTAELVKTTLVLNDTESFNLEGIGKFKTSVIEEREVLDGKLIQISLNWYGICEETNSVYTFGENSYELDGDTGAVTSTEGTWRAGEVNDLGEIAIPAMTMPGVFLLGSKYVFDGAPGVAFGGAENVAHGLGTTNGVLTTTPTPTGYAGNDVPIPATEALGELEGCGQFEEISQDSETRVPHLEDLTNKVWCPGIGLVFDTSDGALTETNIKEILRKHDH